MSDTITAPWSVQVELCEGCNRYCEFCGLRSIRPGTGGYEYLSPELARKIAFECSVLCPLARYEFAMHGEPLQHPRANEIVATFRRALPKAQLQLTTNGKVLMGDPSKRIAALFDAGIDILVVDTYEPERHALQQLLWSVDGHDGIKVIDFYAGWAPHGKSPWTNYHRSVTRTVVILDDLGIRSGETANRVISNHAGNSKLLPWTPAPLKRTCTLPYREMSITANGDVNICCNDWGHEYTCGNAAAQSLETIWNGEAFKAARKVLGQKSREFSPCNRCDARSGSRSGLLPKLEPPSTADLITIETTQAASLKINGHPQYLGPIETQS